MYLVNSEVLTAVLLKIQVFWKLILCHWMSCEQETRTDVKEMAVAYCAILSTFEPSKIDENRTQFLYRFASSGLRFKYMTYQIWNMNAN
jgi:hypothetical protein